MNDLDKINTATIVLALLRNEPMYGYRIVKEMNEAYMGLMHMKEGTIYPLLHDLEQRGLIAGEWRKNDRERTRKYYALTAEGERALEQNLALWRKFSGALNSLIGETP